MYTKTKKNKFFFNCIQIVTSSLFLCFILIHVAQPVRCQLQQENLIAEIADNPKNKVISSFSVLEYSGKTYLKWLVQGQRQNCIFLIERSVDSWNYEIMALSDGYGLTVDVPIMYSFVDSLPIQMTTYYKISVIDKYNTKKQEPEALLVLGSSKGNAGKTLFDNRQDSTLKILNIDMNIKNGEAKDITGPNSFFIYDNYFHLK